MEPEEDGMIIRPWDGFLPILLPAIGPSLSTGGDMIPHSGSYADAVLDRPAKSIPDEHVGEEIRPVLTEFVLTGASSDVARAAVLTESQIQVVQGILFREQQRLGSLLGPGYTESDDEILNIDADTYHEIIGIRKILLAVYGTDDAVN